MQNKIKVYEEILTLDPGSKLFFPLASMLVASGNYARGREVLVQGLAVHPEHTEARLLLLDVLEHLGEENAAMEQGGQVLDLLKKYEGFWTVWQRMLDANREGDTRTALDFLRASLQGRPLTWAGVVEEGLRALQTGSAAEETGTAGELPGAPRVNELPDDADADDVEEIPLDPDVRTRMEQPSAASPEPARNPESPASSHPDPVRADALQTLSALADRLEHRAGS